MDLLKGYNDYNESDIEREDESKEISSNKNDDTEYIENEEKNDKDQNNYDLINIRPINTLNCAPDINTYDLEIKCYKEKFQNIEKKIMFDNPEFHNILNRPQQGPSINEHYNFLKNENKNHYNGSIETTFVNKNIFDYQYNQFNVTGIAENPALKNYYKNNYANYLVAKNINERKNMHEDLNFKKHKKKRSKNNDDNMLDKYKGPWEEKETNKKEQNEEKQDLLNDNKKAKTDNDDNNDKKINKYILTKLEACAYEEAIKNNVIKEKNTLYNDKIISTLHLNEELDDHDNNMGFYNKSWFQLPTEYKERDFMIEENFPPKKEIHTYKGHKMGVQKIRFFPKYGNYLLSASLDNTLKLWSVYKSKSCIRTYKGHFKGVKDVLFDNDGSSFLSCSYDNNVIYWDTEYGKIKGIYNQKKTPYCLCLNPDDTNTFLVGGANNKICHIDFRTGNIELEYNEHLQAINTITLCENNKKLISTSDDKKIFIWEYGLPVVVKYISDASMFSITSVSVHPSNNFFLCQSMNNVITVYEATGKFRLFSKKTFKGHHNIGYSINVSCSNDGKYVISGDSNGGLFIWNWKKMVNFKNIKAHKNVCIDCVWHPFKTSMLATASWDGTIKLWE